MKRNGDISFRKQKRVGNYLMAHNCNIKFLFCFRRGRDVCVLRKFLSRYVIVYGRFTFPPNIFLREIVKDFVWECLDDLETRKIDMVGCKISSFSRTDCDWWELEPDITCRDIGSSYSSLHSQTDFSQFQLLKMQICLHISGFR